MTTRETAIDLEFWQVRGLLVMLALAGCAAFLPVYKLSAWEISLQKRERFTQIGEAYCLGQVIEAVYHPPATWLTDARSDDPLWLALDADLVRECQALAPPPDDLEGEPFTLADGTPLPTLTVKGERAP
ncbi:MAG: hypothetical protein AAFR33_10185 [Pseudomonadota bacterium]